jgi:hypothetical protein
LPDEFNPIRERIIESERTATSVRMAQNIPLLYPNLYKLRKAEYLSVVIEIGIETDRPEV